MMMLMRAPTWWHRNEMPLMVASARRPYTSAVRLVVTGTEASQEKPAMVAKTHRLMTPGEPISGSVMPCCTANSPPSSIT